MQFNSCVKRNLTVSASDSVPSPAAAAALGRRSVIMPVKSAAKAGTPSCNALYMYSVRGGVRAATAAAAVVAPSLVVEAVEAAAARRATGMRRTARLLEEERERVGTEREDDEDTTAKRGQKREN